MAFLVEVLQSLQKIGLFDDRIKARYGLTCVLCVPRNDEREIWLWKRPTMAREREAFRVHFSVGLR